MILARPVAAMTVCVASAATGILVAVGCGSSEPAKPTAAPTQKESHSEAIVHEACSESGHRVDKLDANGDGKPDITRVFDKSTGKEVCRISDLNRDGKADLYEYFDPSGDIRRREADYDDNGTIDAIEYYEHGKLVRREYDTTGQHRIDTWDYFDAATGKRTRRERDTSNDGQIDQWWTWDGDKVTIAMDKNLDGKPDPSETITMGGDGGGPAAASSGPSGATADAGAPAPIPPPTPSVTLPLAAGAEPSPFGPDAGGPDVGDAGPRRRVKR